MGLVRMLGAVLGCGAIVGGCAAEETQEQVGEGGGKGDEYGDEVPIAATRVDCASAAIDAEGFDWVYEGHAFRFSAEDLGDGQVALEIVRAPMWPGEWKQPAVESDAVGSGAIDGDMVSFSFDGGAAELAALAPDLWAGTGRLDPDGDIAITCWTDAFVPAFAYDAERGACIDVAGNTGINPTTQAYVRVTGDGECADLGGLQLNETDFGYPVLEWNLAGARLDGARLHFAHLMQADLSGARMTDFQFGYAILDAAVDDFTQPLPCPASGGRIECQN